MAESKEEGLKPRISKGLSIALTISMLCIIPDSSRAYIPYVQPQLSTCNGPLPRVKRLKLVPVKKVNGYATGYFSPLRKDYKTKGAYLKAIKLNGVGKKTSSGTKPHIGTIAADTRFYPYGTKIFIPEKNLMTTVEDTGSKIRGERHVDIFCGHGKRAERIANAWENGTPITLVVMKKMKV